MPPDNPPRRVIPVKMTSAAKPDTSAAPTPPPTPRQARAQARLHTPSWRWSTLLQAPHRLSFFTAAAVMAVAAAWWWLEMLSRSTGWLSGPSAVPATVVHAVVMSLGFMPLFFCGFLFTAGPKWLQMPEVTAHSILKPVAAVATGWAVLMLGAQVHHLMSAAGVALATVGWLRLTVRFVRMLRQSPAGDRLHASLIAGACAIGVLAMGAAAVGLATQAYGMTRLAALLGLWWFVVPVYVVVAHRMLPFFTASALPVLDAWRPNWLLWTLLGLVALQGLWVVTDALGGASQPVLMAVRGVSAAASSVLVLALAVRWGLLKSLRIRLLAMLHLGFVWLGVALGLDAVSALLGVWGGASLGLLPLHALTMGFLGSVLMAMATRVTCGHGGRALTADNLVWALFCGLQLATVLRLVAVLWSAQASLLLLAAASLWLVVMGGWALRYGRWYGRPRIDGRPG